MHERPYHATKTAPKKLQSLASYDSTFCDKGYIIYKRYQLYRASATIRCQERFETSKKHIAKLLNRKEDLRPIEPTTTSLWQHNGRKKIIQKQRIEKG